MSEIAVLSAKTAEKKGKESPPTKTKENFYESMDSPVEQILYMQRTIGNQAVQRLIKSGKIQAKLKIGKPNDKYEQEADRIADKVMSMPEPKQSSVNSHSSLAQRESTCPECPEKEGIQTKPLVDQITPLVQRQADEEEEPVQTKLLQRQEAEEEEEPVQTKLLQRQDADEEEEPVQTKLLQRQEAEEEEEEVQPKLQRQETDEEEEPIQTKLLQRQELDEEEEPVQAKPAINQTPSITSNIESNVNSLKGGGQPLPESTRSYFEPRFGADFSQVRVHTDSNAAEAAKSINAKAFTTGKDVVFGDGQYSQGTSSGKRLLAHELTHIVQQGYERGSKPGVNIKASYHGFVQMARLPKAAYDAEKLFTHPSLSYGRLTPKNLNPKDLNEIEKQLEYWLANKWADPKELGPRYSPANLVRGLAKSNIPFSRWPYLIAQSRCENAGRIGLPNKNEFNIGVRAWVNELVDNSYNMLKRPSILRPFTEALQSYQKAGGKLLSGFDPLSARAWRSLRGPRKEALRKQLIKMFREVVTPETANPKGIETAAKLLIAYTSNQLYHSSLRRELHNYDVNAVIRMKRYMKDALRKIQEAGKIINPIPPSVVLVAGQKILVQEATSKIKAVLSKLKINLTNIKGVKDIMRDALIKLKALVLQLFPSNYGIYGSKNASSIKYSVNRVGYAIASIKQAEKIQMASERFEKMGYIKKATFAYLASTGDRELRISGIKQAGNYLLNKSLAGGALSQVRRFQKNLKEVRNLMNWILIIVLGNRP